MCFLRLTERSPRKEADIVLLTVIDNEIRFTIRETEAILHRDNRHDLACPFNVFPSHIRERDMTNLTLTAQIRQRFNRRFKGHSIVGSVQLINVDTLQAQTFQTPLERFSKMFRARIMCPLTGSRTLPSTLSSDHQSRWIWVERFCDQLL